MSDAEDFHESVDTFGDPVREGQSSTKVLSKTKPKKMAMSNFKKAENELIQLTDDISSLETRIRSKDPTTKVEVNHYLKKSVTLEQQLTNLKLAFSQCQKTDEEAARVRSELSSISDTLDDLILNLQIKQETFASSSTPTISTEEAKIRLPTIELPKFSGKPQDWLEFHDMYKTAIHDNSSLSKVKKLTYLQSCLQNGPAREIINGFTITEDNYDIAWQALKQRFENKRELYFQVMQNFITIPHASGDNASSLRSIVDGTNKCIRQISNLSIPDQWDAFLAFSITRKLDPASRQLWEQNLIDTDIPTSKSLLDFIEARARSINVSSRHPKPIQFHNPERTRNSEKHVQYNSRPSFVETRPFSSSKINVATTVPRKDSKCLLCPNHHSIFKCESFLSLPVIEREAKVRDKKLCLNCIRDGHMSFNCPSKNRCLTCKEKHHTLLHINNPQSSQIHTHTNLKNGKQVILATALIQAHDKHGYPHTLRALIDCGATDSLISEACTRKLGLIRRPCNKEPTGVGNTPLILPIGETTFTFSPRPGISNKKSYQIDSLIYKKVTADLPFANANRNEWTHLNKLPLADPYFNKSNEIDVLLSIDLFLEILLDGKRRGTPGSPIAINSDLGWLVGGAVSSAKLRVFLNNCITPLEETLLKFWELESVPDDRIPTPEEEEAERQFSQNHSRNPDGRYVVAVPTKNPMPKLGSSVAMAVSRLLQIERKLSIRPNERQLYNEFMEKYLNLGHMREFNSKEINALDEHHFIPHQYVFKDSGAVDKFRVVFDASAKTKSGVSINDTQLVGPTIQDSLYTLLLRFRTHKYAFTADISKMFRQILVHPDDQKYQCIVWRNTPSEKIKYYKLLTVTYGTASAPFLAQRVLQQLSQDETNLPVGSEIIGRDVYMDDLMSGQSTLSAAQIAVQQLDQTVKSCGMKFTKWTASHPEVLLHISDEEKETTNLLLLQEEGIVKTLGIYWNTNTDSFTFKVKTEPINSCNLTKRIVTSQVAKTFDPLGWLAPVVITGKIFLQDLWKVNLTWDEQLPLKVRENWTNYYNQLPLLEKVHLPRCVIPDPNLPLELHGFCDASEKAYAATIYIRSKIPNQQKYQMFLVTSKTKVAPTKVISIPRLELCSALLLSKLIKTTKSSLKIEFSQIKAWTDSTISLTWIQGHPSEWKTFVGNRTTKIQNHLPAEYWNYIPGVDNPADCASRGLTAEELLNHPLWWSGPKAMQDEYIPEAVPKADDSIVEAERKKQSFVNHVSYAPVFCDLIHKYSTLKRLTRQTAWCLRFINILKFRIKLAPQPTAGAVLGVPELDLALRRLIQMSQALEFHDEIQRLKSHKPLRPKSKILSLDPFLDDNQILRVGGRLGNSKFTADKKYPILLSRRCHLTKLIILNTHLTNHHSGPQLTLAILNNNYWIIRGRDAVRFLLRTCHSCIRQKAVTMTQKMGDLPQVRVTQANPFKECGIDFAGPISIRPIQPRSTVTLKAYIAVFVCMVTHAVHLELVSAMSTDAFMATFRRFCSRRNTPRNMYSDCGTNFVGAANELRDLYKYIESLSTNQLFLNQLANEKLTWHFNPPAAPHWGGLWEAAVKSTKYHYHLHRIVGNTRLTFEEMTTLLTQIEACLNSRPLTPISSDPNDLVALTPAHFLVGESLRALPCEDFTTTPINRLSRWQHLQQMQQHFFTRWSTEHMNNLQQRPKWKTHQQNLKVDDLVLIKGDNVTPFQWPLARVIKTHPGLDGLVRSATLKTQTAIVERPIVKLIPLPMESADPKPYDNRDVDDKLNPDDQRARAKDVDN